jgi:soluble lytic murein transglycosylase-like protein
MMRPKAQEVDPKLLRAVMEQESGLRPCAVCGKGAMGLMQLMPATIEQFAVHDPFTRTRMSWPGAISQLMDKYKGGLRQAGRV